MNYIVNLIFLCCNIALPADFNVGERRADFVEYFTGITWEEKLKPKISAVTNHLKAQGVETISTIGFCW